MLLDVDFLSLLPEILPMDVQDGRKGQKIDDNEAANVEKVHKVVVLADPDSHIVAVSKH